MSIVLLILKIIGWTLLALLAVVIIALFLPLTLSAKADDDGILVRLKILFYRRTLYDSGAPEKPEKPPKEEKQEEPKKEKTSESSGSGIDTDMIKALVAPALSATRFILRHISITHIDLVVVIHSFDPYDTGVNTGRVWTAFGAISTLLKLTFRRTQYDRLIVIPDFMDEHADEWCFGCDVTMRGATAVAAAFIVLKRLLVYKIKSAYASAGATEKECLAQ